jgi:adenine-specific DNA-methyltransferase
VVFTERVFPGMLEEEVVLLLAEDALAPGGTDHCELHQVAAAADLGVDGAGDLATRHRWRPGEAGGKWTPALLSSAALAVYGAAVGGAGFTGLQTWGETTLGR